MALITRVSRLFQADLHAVIDRIEEPYILLKQAVREMEEALDNDERHFKALHHEQTQLQAQYASVNDSLNETEEALNVCCESNQDDLARKVVKTKLETLQFKKFLSRKLNTLEQTISGLHARLDENRSNLVSMRQKAELLADEKPSSSINDNWNYPGFAVRDEDVEVTLLREKQKRRAL